MGVISHLNTHEARFNPEAVFAEPEALEAEVGLTAGQKLAALERWSLDVEARLVVEAGDADAALLGRLKACMARIAGAD